MTIVAHYQFPRGSQVIIPLDYSADAGEDFDTLTITASARYSGFYAREVTDDMGEPISLAVETRSNNAGWFLTYDSDDMENGFYVAGIRVTAPDYDQTSANLALIEITEPVTGGA